MNLCLEHQKELILFCLQDLNLICEDCVLNHKALKHTLIDKENGSNEINTQIPNLIKNYKENLKKNQSFKPSNSSLNNSFDLNKHIQVINMARNKLILNINEFFENFTENIEKKYSKNPTKEFQNYISIKINSILEELNLISTKISDKKIDLEEIQLFFQRNFQKSLEKNIEILDNFSKNLSNPFSSFTLPELTIDEKSLEILAYNLNDYIKFSNKMDLIIEEQEYFNPNQEEMFSIINETFNTITITNLKLNKTITLPLNKDFEIPYSHSIIVTPNSQIFMTGGMLLSNGSISGECFEFSPNEICLKSKTSMKVKRVGHSLIYCNIFFFFL